MNPIPVRAAQNVQNSSQQAPAAAKQKTKEQVLFETLQPSLGHNQEVRRLIVEYAADLTRIDEGNAFLKMGQLKKAKDTFLVATEFPSTSEEAKKGLRRVVEKIPNTSEDEAFFFECLEALKESWARISEIWFEKFILPFFVQHPDAEKRMAMIENKYDSLFYQIKICAYLTGGEHFEKDLLVAKQYCEQAIYKFKEDSAWNGFLGRILIALAETVEDSAEKREYIESAIQSYGKDPDLSTVCCELTKQLEKIDEGNASLGQNDLNKAIASFAVVINEEDRHVVLYSQAVKGVRQVLEKVPHTSENEAFFFDCLELLKTNRFSNSWFDTFILPFFVQHPDAKMRVAKIEGRTDMLFYHIKIWAYWYGGEHFKPDLQMAKMYAEEGVKQFPEDGVWSDWLGCILLEMSETITDVAKKRGCLEAAIELLEKCGGYEDHIAVAKERLSKLDTDVFDFLHKTIKDTFDAGLSKGNEADRGFIRCVAEALKRLHLSEARLKEIQPIEWIIDHVLPSFRAQSIDPKACPRIRTRLATLEQMSATDENLKLLLLLILWKGTNVIHSDHSRAIQLAEGLRDSERYAMPIAYILGDLYFQKSGQANTAENVNRAKVRLETNAKHIKDQKMVFGIKLSSFGFKLSEIHSQLSYIYRGAEETTRLGIQQLKISE